MCEFDAADHERKVPPPTGDEKSTKIDHSGKVKLPLWERPPGSDSGPGGSNLSLRPQKCLRIRSEIRFYIPRATEMLKNT